MRLLLDTHALIWWLQGAEVAHQADTAIRDPLNEVLVSAASAWEIAIKRALRRLRFDADLDGELHRNRFTALPITMAHALAAGALPAHQQDPFDRMLIAQAVAEDATLVTRDQAFAAYGVPIIAA